MRADETQIRQAMTASVAKAQRAPSILNTQPWRWQIHDEEIDLYADRHRQVPSIDPDARLLTLSCGAALHHARTALSGAGFETAIERFPDSADPDLTAKVRLVDRHDPRPGDVQMVRNMQRRHTDRRPFEAIVPVPHEALSWLNRAAEAEHAWLYRVTATQMPFLRSAADTAASAEAEMPDYQADLEKWTHRPWSEADGVTSETVSAQVTRPVRLRDFAPGSETRLDPGFGDDRFAEYLIVTTPADAKAEWLMAGEATSAAWLTATGAGLVMSVMSDVVEIPAARALLAELLDPPGYPQLVLRVGVDMQATPAPTTRRRAVTDADDAGGHA